MDSWIHTHEQYINAELTPCIKIDTEHALLQTQKITAVE